VKQVDAASFQRSVELWVCDRNANRLLALDRSLLVLGEVLVDRPLGIAARSDGGVWVRAVREGGEVLASFSARGELLAEIELGMLHDLESDEVDRAVVLQASAMGSRSLLRIGGDGACLELACLEGGDFLACGDGTILVGTSAGVLRLLDGGGRELARRSLGMQLLAVAAAPGRAFWALAGGEKHDAFLLDGRLHSALGYPRAVELCSGGAAAGALPFAITSDGAAWTIGKRAHEVQRIGESSASFRGWVELPRSCPVLDAEPLRRSGLVVASPGALVAIEPFGGGWRSRRVQGGFGCLCDVETVPRSPRSALSQEPGTLSNPRAFPGR
jgi:hypothetical protein